MTNLRNIFRDFAKEIVEQREEFIVSQQEAGNFHDQVPNNDDWQKQVEDLVDDAILTVNKQLIGE